MIATDVQIGTRPPTLSRVGGSRHGAWVLGLLLILAAGCSHARDRGSGHEELGLPPSWMIAVGPGLNYSGCSDFDPVKMADLMASELSELPGVGVIGVNRILAVLAEQGVDRIQSPQHALAVCERVGADAILVFAVTEYDAYTPIVGLAAQLYCRQPEGPATDGGAASQIARPFPVVSAETRLQPRAQVQRTFHGGHDDIQSEVRRYADSRIANKSPYGWKKYLQSQQGFVRFCCHTVATDLTRQYAMGLEATPAIADVAAVQEQGR